MAVAGTTIFLGCANAKLEAKMTIAPTVFIKSPFVLFCFVLTLFCFEFVFLFIFSTDEARSIQAYNTRSPRVESLMPDLD